MTRMLAAVALALLATLVRADERADNISPATYGQSLLQPAIMAEPAVSSLVLHAVPPGEKESVVVAATDRTLLGQHSQLPPGTLPAAGRLESNRAWLPLLDVSGDPIGVLEVGFAGSGPGDAPLQLRQAQSVRQWLGRRIAHVGNLLDPFPYERDARLHTRAQQLVDEVLARHPDVQIFAIHATPPEGDYNVIAGSNIGRIGKKGDNDDMRCVYTGKPNLEVNATGRRFEAELQLHDRGGTVIGAVGIVFGYHAGVDRGALQRTAEAIRAELEPQIADAQALFAPLPLAPPLVAAGRTELPGYSGDFDHFEIDAARNRLLLAAEDHGTLEVFELSSGKHLRTIKGFDTPHSPFLVPGTDRLLLTDGSDSIKVLDAQSYRRRGEIKTHPGADSIAYDAVSGHLFVVTGGKDVKLEQSWLEQIDPRSGAHLGETRFEANHVEAVALEPGARRIYVNVTDKNQIAVIAHQAIVASWPIREAGQNAMAQFDPVARALYVVTRSPAKFLALDAATGATRAVFDAPEHSDQELFDAANRRIYAPGGDGHIGVYAIDVDGTARALAPVTSAAGAKTGILVPALHRLYLAVSPGAGRTGGALIWFDVSSAP